MGCGSQLVTVDDCDVSSEFRNIFRVERCGEQMRELQFYPSTMNDFVAAGANHGLEATACLT